ALLLEVSNTLAKGQMTGQLNKANQIAALAATVTVEEIFASVDVERRPGFRMQWAESNELGPESDRPGGPTLLLQIIEQRQTLFQLFDILAHGANNGARQAAVWGGRKKAVEGRSVPWARRRIWEESARGQDL